MTAFFIKVLYKLPSTRWLYALSYPKTTTRHQRKSPQLLVFGTACESNDESRRARGILGWYCNCVCVHMCTNRASLSVYASHLWSTDDKYSLLTDFPNVFFYFGAKIWLMEYETFLWLVEISIHPYLWFVQISIPFPVIGSDKHTLSCDWFR